MSLIDRIASHRTLALVSVIVLMAVALFLSILSATSQPSVHTVVREVLVPGPAGPPGPPGADGKNGAVGAPGSNGKNGNAGPIGRTGSKGQNGQTGATGKTGTTGKTGETGKTGPRGVQGRAGPVCPPGFSSQTLEVRLRASGNQTAIVHLCVAS